MIQSDDKFQINKIKWCHERLSEGTLLDLYIELFSYNMEYPHSLDLFLIFLVSYSRLEWLYLELLGPRCGYFDIDIFVEHNRYVVDLPSFQFFPTIDL